MDDDRYDPGTIPLLFARNLVSRPVQVANVRILRSRSPLSATRPGVLLPLLLGVLVAACSGSDAGVDRAFTFDGPDTELFNAEGIAGAAFEVSAEGDDAHLDDIRMELRGDGSDQTITEVEGAGEETDMQLEPGDLDDGEYRVTVLRTFEPAEGEEPPEDPQEPEVLHEWPFAVDATPPQVEISAPDGAVIAGEPVTIAGRSEPGAQIEVDGASTTAGDADGEFEIELDPAPEGTLTVVATDAAGNSSDDDLRLVTVPSRVEVDEIRGMHVSFCAWTTASLREPVLQAIEDGLINAIQLDLKDEAGEIGFESSVPLAGEVGATAGCEYDLEETVAELHDLGVPIIGRIVAFRDPLLAQWAWDNGHRDRVLRNHDGEMAATRYGGFANFVHPEVIAYNLDIAEEAAAAGVDHILWDYIRRPGGDLDQYVIDGLGDGENAPREAVTDFTRQADERLAPYGIQHGASLYGGSATRPHEVGQDVPALAEHLDYVGPMLYPTHWNAGEYDLSEPWADPYELILRSLEDWEEATDGRRARLVPWLEDSNWPITGPFGLSDRAAYVRDQIRGTYDSGLREWLLWDSSVNYTEEAILQPEPAPGSAEE